MTVPFARRRVRLTLGLWLVTLAAVATHAETTALAERRDERRAADRRTPAVDMQALQQQVALDRAGFSVGAIDGRSGAKTRKALAAFQQARGAGAHDGAASADAVLPPIDTPATTDYVVTDADLAGPFVDELPKDLQEQGGLDALAYTSIVELLAERFHTTPALLRALNASLDPLQPGRTIVVPNVEPMTLPESSGRRRERTSHPAPAFDVTVSRASSDIVVRDAGGVVRFYAPVSSGSEHDPLPIGEWTVEGVYLLPVFFYNPDLFWDADPSHAKTKIAAGPNNPVGAVWIDISRPHYGLHGTPEPTSVGVTQSHGCVRLTNWDALRLAAFVTEGTAVHFTP